MPHPIPYLNFPGTCAAAARFYERALGAKIAILMTYGESPAAAHCAPESHGDVMHARLELPDGGTLMAGDCPRSTKYPGIHGVGIALNYATVADAKRAFEALADGGTVTMPLQPTFWAKIWGMLTDRFGTPWIINGELLPL